MKVASVSPILRAVGVGMALLASCPPLLAQENGRADSSGEEAERPAPLDPIFDTINPAKIQRLFDRMIGLDSGDLSDKPRAPEIPEPLFFDVVRPLGDVKYATELNYLYNPSSRNAPTLQAIEYEYVFADWRAAELDLYYFNGNLEVLTPFYQRTFGVGRDGNWVHGVQLSLDLYLRSGFVGCSPVYVVSWKPERESRFSATMFVGANRALIGGFNPSRVGSSALRPGSDPLEHPFGAWRPTCNLDVFYKLGEKWTVGVETDLFIHSGEAGEYLSFPFLTYEAGEHAFLQVGAGYYHFESRDQLTFLAHINFVNASTRRSREPEPDSAADVPDEPRREGPLKRLLNRLSATR